MKITKICKEHPEVSYYEGDRCINCNKANAEVVLEIGCHQTQLCLECAWNLKDLMDETTYSSFTEAER